MTDPGVLYYKEDPVEILKGGGRLPISNFGPNDYSLVSKAVSENLAQLDPSITETTPVQAAVFSIETVHVMHSFQSDMLCVSENGSGKTIAYLVPVIRAALSNQMLAANRRGPGVLIFVPSVEKAEAVHYTLLQLTVDMGLKIELLSGNVDFIQNPKFDIGVCNAHEFEIYINGTRKVTQLDLSGVRLVVVDDATESLKWEHHVELYQKIRTLTRARFYFFSSTMESSDAFHSLFNYENSYCYLHGDTNAIPAKVQTVFWEIMISHLPLVYVDETGKINTFPTLDSDFLKPCNPCDMLYYAVNRRREKLPNTRFLIFATNATVADFLAVKLKKLKIPACAYHDRQNTKERKENLIEFTNDTVKVLVTTEELLRRDVQNVDIVINFDMPLSYATFLHRCHCVGRNGKKAIVVTFIDKMTKKIETRQAIATLVQKTPKEDIPPFLKNFSFFKTLHRTSS
uniref:ATP-dependent RNA helicase n=1 Tax=Panagrellus redivivus TaxID=6233 RepID=A0A7E4VR81_PANRE